MQAHRKTLKAIMAALHGNYIVTLDTKFDDFEAALRGADTDTLEGPQAASLPLLCAATQFPLKGHIVISHCFYCNYRRASVVTRRFP